MAIRAPDGANNNNDNNNENNTNNDDNNNPLALYRGVGGIILQR